MICHLNPQFLHKQPLTKTLVTSIWFSFPYLISWSVQSNRKSNCYPMTHACVIVSTWYICFGFVLVRMDRRMSLKQCVCKYNFITQPICVKFAVGLFLQCHISAKLWVKAIVFHQITWLPFFVYKTSQKRVLMRF